MISILVTLLILAVFVYIAYLIVGMLHLPQPLVQIIYVIMAVIVILVLLDIFGLYKFNLR